MSDFKKVCLESYEKLRPNLIANYVYELSKMFNDFYHKYSVLKTDEELMKARLGLVSAVRQVIKNSLGLLGIESPERM
jgi:arginyl-tRNA synthetase